MNDYLDNQRSRRARKLTLPSFILTEICDELDEGAKRISLSADLSKHQLFERPKREVNGQRLDGKANWKPTEFNFYPIILDASGLPWYEANLYILIRLENSLDPSMTTYDGIADDLVAYRRFIDDEEISWRTFVAQKLSRPTYRYNSHLRRAVNAGTMSVSVARRRMSSVIAFYAWLKSEGLLVPEYPPWRQADVFFKLTGANGIEFIKRSTTTDINIRGKTRSDPYSGHIEDGGKLRPLSREEQCWVIEALLERGNTEMTLIHLLALLTGARIQTVLTFKVRHIRQLVLKYSELAKVEDIRLPVGQGTGIDTKRNKCITLHIPAWMVQQLSSYVESDRARKRRILAKGGDTDNQYLFLSKYGTPLYLSKEDSRIFDEDSTLRNPIKGQSVRKFITEAVIPFVRKKYDVKFHYQFHDLRATFGMNLTDLQLKNVEQKRSTLSQVREFVKVRMGHDSAATTDRYLQFRENHSQILSVIDSHDDYLRDLITTVDRL